MQSYLKKEHDVLYDFDECKTDVASLQFSEIRVIALKEKLYSEEDFQGEITTLQGEVTDELFCHVNVLEGLRNQFFNVENLIKLQLKTRSFKYQEIISHPLFIFGLREEFFRFNQFLQDDFFNLNNFPIFFYALTAQHKAMLNAKLISFSELYALFDRFPQLFFQQNNHQIFEFLCEGLKNKWPIIKELLSIKNPEKLLSEEGLAAFELKFLFNEIISGSPIKTKESLNHPVLFAQSPKIYLKRDNVVNNHPLFAIRKDLVMESKESKWPKSMLHNEQKQVSIKKLKSVSSVITSHPTMPQSIELLPLRKK